MSVRLAVIGYLSALLLTAIAWVITAIRLYDANGKCRVFESEVRLLQCEIKNLEKSYSRVFETMNRRIDDQFDSLIRTSAHNRLLSHRIDDLESALRGETVQAKTP